LIDILNEVRFTTEGLVLTEAQEELAHSMAVARVLANHVKEGEEILKEERKRIINFLRERMNATKHTINQS